MSSDDGDMDIMKQLVSILYCRAVFKEFRRPVLATYPELAETYLITIPRPMDLGTLVLKTIKEPMTKEHLQRDLTLICKNALTFNKGYHTIESITGHLWTTMQGLYEELLLSPFSKTGQSDADDTPFYVIKRCARYKVLKDVPLSESELKILVSILHDFPSTDFPNDEEFVARLLKHTIALSAAWSENRSVSLSDCLSLIGSELCTPARHPESSEIRFAIISGLFEGSEVSEEREPLLEAIDDMLGVFAVLLEERYLKGTIASTYWAKPHHIPRWYPLEKDAKRKTVWWPCLVLAGPELSASVVRRNIERLPAAMAKQLLKARPKTPSLSPDVLRAMQALTKFEKEGPNASLPADLQALDSEASDCWSSELLNLSLTEQLYQRLLFRMVQCSSEFLMVEFLGDPFVGWAKAASCIAMEGPFTPELFPEGEKVCPVPIQEAAEEIRRRLLKNHLVCCDADEEKDRINIPTVAELQHTTDCSAAMLNYSKFLARKRKSLGVDDRGRSTEVSLDELQGRRTVSKFSLADFAKVDFNVCIDGDKFVPSKCPLPVRVQGTSPAVKSLNYRRNALMRTRAFIHYAQIQRPLVVLDSASQGLAAYLKPLYKQELEKPPEDEKVVVESNPASAQKTKRKYEFKWKPPAPDSSADIYIDRTVGTVSLRGGKPLECGCSRYLAGEGLVYTRKVDFSSALFFKESVVGERRKRLLVEEVDAIEKAVEELLRGREDEEVMVEEGSPRTKRVRPDPPTAPHPSLPGKIGMIAKLQTSVAAASTASPADAGPESARKAGLPMGVSDMLPF